MSNETKKIIFLQAVKIFSQKGFEQASMDEIAEQSGIAKGTLYYHFNGKKDLFTSLIREGIDNLENKVRQKITPDTSSLSKLSIIIKVLVNFIQENRDFGKILVTELWGESRWQEDILQIRGGFIKTFESIVTEGQSRDEIKKIIDPPTYAAGFFGMISAAALHWAMYEKVFPKKEIIATLENSLVDAIKA